MTKNLTYGAYLRLIGLLTLASDHRKMLTEIEHSARSITGDVPLGHTSDAVWGGYDHDAPRLLELLGIPLPTPSTTPEDAGRHAAGAMRITKQFDDLREE